MRIISKFRDYYDSSMGLGIDKDLIYNRKESSEILSPSAYPSVRKISRPLITSKKCLGKMAFIGVVFFCGTSYPFIAVGDPSGDDFIGPFFNTADFLGAIKEFNPEIYRANTSQSKHRWGNTIMQDFEELAKIDPTEIHFKYGSPILKVVPDFGHRSNIELVVNPELSSLGFYRIFDSYSAFQEIDMYIGGVLGDIENKAVVISDEEKALKQGYHKYSFKTRPKK